MRQIMVSESTFRKLIELKNHWSFQQGRVTNPEVLRILNKVKKEIFGYTDSTPPREIEEICKKKSREQLEMERERFTEAYQKLLVSGYDFEPEYTLDEHIRRMLELIDEEKEIYL